MANTIKYRIRQLIGKCLAVENKLTCILWIFIYTILNGSLAYYIYGIFVKWYIDPDISTNIRTVSVHDIPFPSITYCTPNIIPDEVVNFTEFQQKLFLNMDLPSYSDKDKNLLGIMIEICSPSYVGLKGIKNRQESTIAKLINQSINDDLMPSFCRFEESDIDCTKMFNPVLTRTGLCFTFNMQGYNTIFNKGTLTDDYDFYKRPRITKSLNISSELYNQTVDDDYDALHWTLQNGYTSNEIDIIPYRLSKRLLHLYIKPEIMTYFKCIGNYFYIGLSLPNEIPLGRSDGIFVNITSLTQIKIGARTIQRNQSIRKYSPEIRKCFFDGEKQLKFFKAYTKVNCDFECLTNFTVKSCGCARFFMPRSQEIRECNIEDLLCVGKAYTVMNVYKSKIDNFAVPCNCLPSCNRIIYSAKKTLSEPLENSNHLFMNKLNFKDLK